ncbi:MAG: DNA methylase [Rhodocyclales bacterium RIFCSPLOWO2_02_FULL_63_24]|nr:MAG: DNA methylase [Rhodocyclales bacterium RIFCSPLOWO2_02_FULL_63_24]
MEKLKLHTPNLTAENIEKLATLFPNCVTESADEKTGQLKRAIDFDQLRQELADHIVEGPRERYHLDWPGKREALLAANAPIAKTLRPYREESVDFDTTKNLFIEGDNLDALKLLQETYLGKVKLIYIDPPYNTGNDFIYDDYFAEDAEEYFVRSNQADESGNRLVANTESNGRFHSDWMNMLYPRIKLARNLLGEDGVLFLSIGQEEIGSASFICSEIFGESNRIGVVGRAMKRGGNNGRFFSPNLEFILVYARDIETATGFKDKMSQDLIDKVYNQIEREGTRKGEFYRTMGLYQPSLTLERSRNARYFIECPDGSKCIPPPNKRWRVVEQGYLDMRAIGDIEFKRTSTSPLIDEKGNPSQWNVYTKIWLNNRQEEGQIPVDLITKFENRHAAKELIALGIPFDFAKPSALVQYLLTIAQVQSDDIVLDFFAGSATTAHAVMAMNGEDGGKRRHIMVQLPERCEEGTDAFRAGYRLIPDIGKERIRRAGAKIKDENTISAPDLDIGFRVLKIDTSNMMDVYYAPDAVKQDQLALHTDNIKEDRTPEDLLFQVLVDWGVDLALPIEQQMIAGKTVFFVDGNALAACFDPNVTEDLVKELAKRKPLRAVFRDSSYASDSTKINVVQIFKLLSPDTEVKSL